jgi:hypothetical protein
MPNSDGQSHLPLAGNMYNVHKYKSCANFDENTPLLNSDTKSNHNLIIGIKYDTVLLIWFTQFSLHPICTSLTPSQNTCSISQLNKNDLLVPPNQYSNEV